MDVLVLFTGEIHDIYQNIEIPADGTGTGELFESVPSLTCEMDGAVIASSGHGLWLSGPSQSEVEDALDRRGRSEITPRSVATRTAGSTTSNSNPTPSTPSRSFSREGGTVLSASASNGTWLLSVRVVDRESVSSLYDRLDDNDVTPTIVRLFDLAEESHSQCGLTARQYRRWSRRSITATSRSRARSRCRNCPRNWESPIRRSPSACRAYYRARHVRTQRDRRTPPHRRFRRTERVRFQTIPSDVRLDVFTGWRPTESGPRVEYAPRGAHSTDGDSCGDHLPLLSRSHTTRMT